MALPDLDHIIFMKVGFHADEGLDVIIDRKMQEQVDAGVIFWGFGGSTCNPHTQVQPFAKEVEAKGGCVILAMSFTTSRFESSPHAATRYSVDGKAWKPMRSGITVTGSKHALVINDLRQVNTEIHLEDYVVGIGPKAGKRLSGYIRGQNDKGCGVYVGGSMKLSGTLLTYVADLVPPYAVFLSPPG